MPERIHEFTESEGKAGWWRIWNSQTGIPEIMVVSDSQGTYFIDLAANNNKETLATPNLPREENKPA